MLRTCAAYIQVDGHRPCQGRDSASKPLFIRKMSRRGKRCGGRQKLWNIKEGALPVTARKLAASALRADLGVFLTSMQHINDGDVVSSNAVDHQVVGMHDRLTGTADTTRAIR